MLHGINNQDQIKLYLTQAYLLCLIADKNNLILQIRSQFPLQFFGCFYFPTVYITSYNMPRALPAELASPSPNAAANIQNIFAFQIQIRIPGKKIR